MYFESVTCRAFGPFRNRTLSLKAGMNVIFGPNEAGKSTWSAAIAIGLCGRRRGRGARAEDRAFAQRHRPWDDQKEWAVSAVVHLADGRKIELSHDLAGGVESSARDAQYANRDLSSEIMNDGAPDGAKWLGLDRRSFQSIAYVRQSELLSILGDANSLQTDLQRAAATARTDATASDAVSRLEAFQHERVGTSRSPTKPLRRSQDAVESAQDALIEAQQKHTRHRSRRQKIDALEGEVSDGKIRIAAIEAVLAEDRAIAATERYKEARILNDGFPDGPPRESPERDQLAQRIVTVLDRWRKLEDARLPTGPTVVEITEQITALKAEEDALLAARAERDLAEAEQRLAQARKLAARFPDAQRPQAPAEEEDLARRATTALEKWDGRPKWLTPPSPSVEDMEAELRETDLRITQLTATSLAVEVLRSAPRLGLGVVGVVAAVLALVGTIWSWISLLGLLVSTGWWFVRLMARQGTTRGRRQADLAEQRRRLERAITTRQLDDRQREENQQRVSQAEQDVRRAADDIGITREDVHSVVEALREWRSRRKKDLTEFKRLSDDWDALQRLLGGRSLAALASTTDELEKRVKKQLAAVSGSLLATARQRNISIEDLVEFQREADAKRGRLRTALGRRQEADQADQQQGERRKAAVIALATAAADAGVSEREPEGQAAGLDEWLEHRGEEIAAFEQRSGDWDRLQQVLGGSSLAELDQVATELTEEARALSAKLPQQSLAEARELEDTKSEVAGLRASLEEKQQDLQRSLGEIEEFRTTLPDLAQAEEALAVAKEERNRIAQLDSILTKTIGFLKTAEDRVHRDLAPVLQRGVLHRLSAVTGGRYIDCRVDPQTLTVEVSGHNRPWRAATKLSHGTAEQIYLLLRLALTRHLGKQEETCPLILDDPVGTSDESRRSALLETLLTISDERQVILFTHDVDVRTWSEQHLTGPRNQLEQLDVVGIPA